MKVIDWQCFFTDHQSHTWLAARDCFDEEIIHVVARISSELREKQGWSPVDLSEFKTILLKKKGWWKHGCDLLAEYPDAVHIFGGFWADKRFFPLILYALWRGRKIVVFDEPYATEAVGYLSNSSAWKNRVKVFLRPRLYALAALMIKALSGLNKFCMLAVSLRGVGQFERAGFLHEQLFPFGYFVPKLKGFEIDHQPECSSVRLIFLGSLLKVKGLDLAVSVVESLHQEGVAVELDVYGHGEANDYINPLSECVSYKGTVPFGQGQTVIAGYDALVLPSRHDGWGVVVNEALLQDVPVVVSSHVGAKCLIENGGGGAVFESGDEDSLRKVLYDFCSNPLLRRKQKMEAGQIASLISTENAARYMKDVLEFYFEGRGERPNEIWCDQV